eukprot:4901427-Amphidinium_carterae.1
MHASIPTTSDDGSALGSVVQNKVRVKSCQAGNGSITQSFQAFVLRSVAVKVVASSKLYLNSGANEL